MKEEIQNIIVSNILVPVGQYEGLSKASQAIAERVEKHAIDFAEWVNKHIFLHQGDNWYAKSDYFYLIPNKAHTTKELYTIYLTSLSTKEGK